MKKMVRTFPKPKYEKMTIYGAMDPSKRSKAVSKKDDAAMLKSFGKTWYDTIRGKTTMVRIPGSKFPGKYKLKYKKRKKSNS